MHNRLKQTEWHKYTTNKKVVMTLVYGQYAKATLIKLVLGTTYEPNRNAVNLMNFLDQLQLVCYQNVDSGLSYNLYKEVIAIKSLHDSINPRPEDFYGYREVLKVKYSATTTIFKFKILKVLFIKVSLLNTEHDIHQQMD